MSTSGCRQKILLDGILFINHHRRKPCPHRRNFFLRISYSSFLARVSNLFSVHLPAPYPLWMLPLFLLWIQLSLVSDTSDLPEWIDHRGGLYFAEQHSFCFFDHEGGSQWMTVVVLQCSLLGMFVGQSAENCFEISHALSPSFLWLMMFSHLCSHLSRSNKPCCLLKIIVWVHINSKWSAVVLASIISWSEVSIRGIESPVAFVVRVQWIFSKLVTDGLLENCLDFGKVDHSFIEHLIPHPCDRHSLLKVSYPLIYSSIQYIKAC